MLNNAYVTLQKFKALGKPKDIDPEAFYRLVLTVRSVAVARPYNLIKFAENLPVVEITSPTSKCFIHFMIFIVKVILTFCILDEQSKLLMQRKTILLAMHRKPLLP